MTTFKPARFREYALRSKLVDQDQIDAAIDVIKQNWIGPPLALDEISDETLMQRMVELGFLSLYQAEQLKHGKTKFNLGPYVIVDYINQGGMGQVFKAEHKLMGREVAVKVLPREKCTPEAIESFEREVRTMARLDHPNLVRAYDAGQDGNVHFLVTEYVPGSDLRHLVRSEGRLSEPQAANIIRQAALGLQYAHDQSLIHRDVKPGNVLVTPEGITKVSDLGLAGFIHEADDDPRAGKIVGTADYLAPEMFISPQDVNHLSDIYALGCTMFYSITGKVPFPGGKPREKIRRHCEEPPLHPRQLNPDLSEELIEIVADMMEKDPALRTQSAGEVAKRLEPWSAEVGEVMSHQPTRSRWLPPPLPTSFDLLAEHAENTGDVDEKTASSGSLPSQDAPSQVSQTTDPVASGRQETSEIDRGGPAIGAGQPTVPRSAVAKAIGITLIAAIPISMLIGGIIAFVLARLLI